MLPQLTDFFALLEINLVICALCLHFLSWRKRINGDVTTWAKWGTVVVFAVLWCPLGTANLPIVAYVRGVSSDLSITLVVLSCIVLLRRMFGFCIVDNRDLKALLVALAIAALFLYPLALGWGDWDPYRLGWGEPGMWLVLLMVSLVYWVKGLRLLPLLVGLALLGWSAGVMESTNLWDYLIDPWLAIFAIFYSVFSAAKNLPGRFQPVPRGVDTTVN